MAEYILAHDLGTSGNKATIFLTDGTLIGSRTYEYPIYCEHPLWAEQDAQDWWKAVCDSTKQLMKRYHVKGEEIRAVSFSGQMMGVLPVDRDGNPLMRAIIWADMRAEEQSRRLGEQIEATRYYHIVGHRNTASYGIQKAMWIQENRPEIYEQTYKFLNAKDYIVYKLTGNFYTDCSDANSMSCLDLAKRDWSEEIVEASGVDYDKLPQVMESVHMAGFVTREASVETGLSTSTKVIVGAGDGVAANVGAGSVAPGTAYCCMGTSAWVAATSEKPVLDENMRMVCWAHAVPGLYSPNGTMQYAGGSYSWIKNTICREEIQKAKILGCSPYDLINQEIEQSCPGANGVLFLPHLKGERAPRWNREAKGVFYGINANTKREDILRSVMEGVVINLGICFEMLKKEERIEEILFIGGMAQSEVWQHAVADVYGINVKIPTYLEEANSMGAAVIAGVGAGIYRDFSAVNKFIEIQKCVIPNQENHLTYKDLMKKYNLLYDALVPVFPFL